MMARRSSGVGARRWITLDQAPNALVAGTPEFTTPLVAAGADCW